MKLQNKWFIGAMLGAAVCLVSTSCVDEIKFGNSFLDKAPGGNATIDTVFNSAEYTRQFLNTCYSRQYYGLPYNTDSNGNIPDSSSPYLGKKDALTDCWSLYFSDATVYQQYYLGSLNANYGTRGNIFPYTREMVWEVVRWCWLLMENIDRVPGMDSTEKTQLVAEAKCLIAARYFDMFRHYGGLPLLYASFTGTESGYEIPRATVEETVNYMIKMLDDAINSGGLVWAYADADLASKAGHWTKAGAMALKCKIWQFAASPLFNDVNGYAGGNSEAEQQHLVWYGGYHAELGGQLGEALLVGGFGEAVVHVGPLVVLAACSRLEVFFGCPDAAQGLKPNRCVFFFTGSGFFKNRRNLLIAFFSGNAGKVRVLVARLRLSGKSRLQILLSLCSLQ